MVCPSLTSRLLLREFFNDPSETLSCFIKEGNTKKTLENILIQTRVLLSSFTYRHFFVYFLKPSLFSAGFIDNREDVMLCVFDWNLFPQQCYLQTYHLQYPYRNQKKETINHRRICTLEQLKKSKKPSMDKQPSPKCQTLSFLPQVRKLMMNHDQKCKHFQTSYFQLVQKLIKPLHGYIEQWSKSGLCPGCIMEFNAQKDGINYCLLQFEKMVNKQVEENRAKEKVRITVKLFWDILDLFYQGQSCFQNKKL